VLEQTEAANRHVFDQADVNSEFRIAVYSNPALPDEILEPMNSPA